MSKEQKTLTVDAALSKGYTQFFHPRHGWQFLEKINDLTKEDFESEDLTLADIKPNYYLVNEESLKELIADQYAQEYEDQTGCDNTNEVYTNLKKIDVSEVVKKINEIFSNEPYFIDSKIKLVP